MKKKPFLLLCEDRAGNPEMLKSLTELRLKIDHQDSSQ